MFKFKEANSKGNKYRYNDMVAHDWGGLLDEPGKQLKQVPTVRVNR